jgi:hypothetical protein
MTAEGHGSVGDPPELATATAPPGEAAIAPEPPLTFTPALTLTPAKTLAPIEPPPATAPAADSLVAAAPTAPPAPTDATASATSAPPSEPQDDGIASAAPAEIASTPAELPSGITSQPPPPPAAAPSSVDTASATPPPGAAVASGSTPGEPSPAPPLEPTLVVPQSLRAAVPGAAATGPATGASVAPAPVERPVAQAAPGRDPAGLGLERLRIRLDGARERTTTRAVDVVSGTLLGGEARRLEVRVGDAVTAPTLEGRLFSVPVSLTPGRNHVRIVAADAQGRETEETLTIQYNAPIGMTITSPPDGHTLTPDDPPLVVVRGEVDDPSVASVWLVAGDRRFVVPVRDGRFRQAIPALEPTVRVRVETPPLADRVPASAGITVHAAAVPTIALLLHWPSGAASPVEASAAWRPRADRPDESLQRVPLGTAQEDGSLTMFYLRNPHPGVYTFALRAAPGAPQALQPALSLPGGALRHLPPVTVNGSLRLLLARVLMPHGILWEQDDWFTGRSASGDTVTKFRFPDGITWTERSGSLPR